MNRRDFILSGLALGLAGLPGAAAAQAPFAPTRFSVRVVGQGPDVILIPGLTAGPEVWASTVAAMPGHRFHLIHVAGFAGAPAGGNARGAVVSPLADALASVPGEPQCRAPGGFRRRCSRSLPATASL